MTKSPHKICGMAEDWTGLLIEFAFPLGLGHVLLVFLFNKPWLHCSWPTCDFAGSGDCLTWLFMAYMWFCRVWRLPDFIVHGLHVILQGLEIAWLHCSWPTCNFAGSGDCLTWLFMAYMWFCRVWRLPDLIVHGLHVILQGLEIAWLDCSWPTCNFAGSGDCLTWLFMAYM